jgi:DNA-binding GntR family transcriptional regulator
MTNRKTTNLALVISPEEASLSDRAYSQIEEMIVTMQLLPETPVSEAQLSNFLGIGRTPIREAIQRLSREHLVTIVPKRGIFISDLNTEKQLRVLETRRELERLICKKAAKRATPNERKDFERLAKEFRKAAKDKDDALFRKADKEFNDLTVIASRNEFAAAAMSPLHGMSRRFWFGNFHHFAGVTEMANLHAAVASAIAKGDETDAGDALDQLIDCVENITRKTIRDSGS